MNDETQLIIETANRIFTDLCSKEVVDDAESGKWPGDLWQTLEETGLSLAGISEQAGGTGGEIQDSLEVIRRSGFFAAPIPLAETFVAARLIEEAGGEVPGGPLTVTSGNFQLSSQGKVQNGVKGGAEDVPFARWCQNILCVDRDFMVLVSKDDINLQPGKNIAGEPRDSINLKANATIDGKQMWELEGAGDRLMQLGALVRSYQMSGALESVLKMSVQYSQERQQFGRPISKFQAIQHQLAIVAGEVAAAGEATNRAGELLDRVHIAVAKSRTGEAAGIAAEITHQVHGAIGYTLEHGLNHRTRRLWGWRDDFGTETEWNLQLGAIVCREGGEGFWSLISSN